MRCFAQFRTICTVLKMWKTPMEGCYILACNLTKSNAPPWVFFTFLKLYKWYHIVQRIKNKSAPFLCNAIESVFVHWNALAFQIFNFCLSVKSFHRALYLLNSSRPDPQWRETTSSRWNIMLGRSIKIKL